jgi:hypothetical protein
MYVVIWSDKLLYTFTIIFFLKDLKNKYNTVVQMTFIHVCSMCNTCVYMNVHIHDMYIYDDVCVVQL